MSILIKNGFVITSDGESSADIFIRERNDQTNRTASRYPCR